MNEGGSAAVRQQRTPTLFCPAPAPRCEQAACFGWRSGGQGLQGAQAQYIRWVGRRASWRSLPSASRDRAPPLTDALKRALSARAH